MVAGLAWLLVHVIGRYAATARRLTADTRLLLGPNPDHHLDTSGPAELAELAGVVNELAERRRAAEGEVARQVSTARAEMEAERNRLAALMAELAVPVLVCDIEGRILLYNGAARLVLGDDPAIGLGRSVYGIVDRGLVTHALDRIREGATAHVATVLRDRQLLQVRLAPVHGADRTLAGFVLVLEDETGRVANSARRDALLRELSEERGPRWAASGRPSRMSWTPRRWNRRSAARSSGSCVTRPNGSATGSSAGSRSRSLIWARGGCSPTCAAPTC